MYCGYCGNKKGKGWHNCAKAQAAKKRLGQILSDINELHRGGLELWDDKDNTLANMSTVIKSAGGEVRVHKL